MPVLQAELPGAPAYDGGLGQAYRQGKSPLVIATGLVIVGKRRRAVDLPALPEVEGIEILAPGYTGVVIVFAGNIPLMTHQHTQYTPGADYRERLFEDYENDFLRQGVQQALIKQLFNPMHWIRSGFMGFNRTEMTIDYYNRIMFDGATFEDLARNGPPLPRSCWKITRAPVT